MPEWCQQLPFDAIMINLWLEFQQFQVFVSFFLMIITIACLKRIGLMRFLSHLDVKVVGLFLLLFKYSPKPPSQKNVIRDSWSAWPCLYNA